MKMKMHFKAWEKKMKKLINLMMIHLGQVQLVSEIFLFMVSVHLINHFGLSKVNL